MPFAYITAFPHKGISAYNGPSGDCKPVFEGLVYQKQQGNHTMTALKYFGLINGGFYVVYGLYGAFFPARITKLMGFTTDLLGSHQIRALWMATAAMGLVMCAAALRMADLVPLTLAIMLLTMGFLAGRLLGLILDGAGPVQTYYEMGLEVVVIALGAFLISRVKTGA